MPQAIGTWNDGPDELKARLPLIEFDQAGIKPSGGSILSADRTSVSLRSFHYLAFFVGRFLTTRLGSAR